MTKVNLELEKEIELFISALEPLLNIRGRLIDESTERAKGWIDDQKNKIFDEIFRDVNERTGLEIIELTENFYNNYRYLKIYGQE